MNTITKSAASITGCTNTILAIDLGKYKSVASVHDQASGVIGFTTIDTTRAELRKLFDREQPGVSPKATLLRFTRGPWLKPASRS